MKRAYHLDKIDREIIWALDKNARYSTTKIGQLIGLSKQKVSFRIRRMVKLGILNLFSTIIAKEKLGYFHCQIYLKFKKKTTESFFVINLKKIPSIHWVAMTKGSYDLVIFLMVKSIAECWKLYQKIIDQFSEKLVKKEILLSTVTYHFNHSYITFSPKEISISEFPSKKIKLKKRDFDLINAIKENGRIQIKKLSQKIKITPFTIRQRIAYLKRKGVIQAFRVRINDHLLGYKRYLIMFRLLMNKPFLKKALIRNLIQDKSIHRLIEVIGKWDLVFDLVLEFKEKPTNWLKNFLLQKKFLKIKSNILEIKKVLPLNTVIYK